MRGQEWPGRSDRGRAGQSTMPQHHAGWPSSVCYPGAPHPASLHRSLTGMELLGVTQGALTPTLEFQQSLEGKAPTSGPQ